MGNETSTYNSSSHSKTDDKPTGSIEQRKDELESKQYPLFASDGRRLAPGEIEYLRLLRPGEHVIPNTCKHIDPEICGPWDCRPMTGVVAQSIRPGPAATVLLCRGSAVDGSYMVATSSDYVDQLAGLCVGVYVYPTTPADEEARTGEVYFGTVDEAAPAEVWARDSTYCPPAAGTPAVCERAVWIVRQLTSVGGEAAAGASPELDLANADTITALPLALDILGAIRTACKSSEYKHALRSLEEALVEHLVLMCVRASAEGWDGWDGHGHGTAGRPSGVTSALESRRWSSALARRISEWPVLARACAIEVCIGAQDVREGQLPSASVLEWGEGKAQAAGGDTNAGMGSAPTEGTGGPKRVTRYLERLSLGLFGALHQVIDTRWAATGRYLLARMPMSPAGREWALQYAKSNQSKPAAGGSGAAAGACATDADADPGSAGVGAAPAASERVVPHPPVLAGPGAAASSDSKHDTHDSTAQVWPPDYPSPGVPPWWSEPGGLPGGEQDVPEPPPNAVLPSTMAWLEAYTRWNAATAGLARVWNTCIDPTLLLGGLASRRGNDVRRLRRELLQASVLLGSADSIEKEAVEAASREAVEAHREAKEKEAAAEGSPSGARGGEGETVDGTEPDHAPAPSADSIEYHRSRMVSELVNKPLSELQAACAGFRAGEMWNALPEGLTACRTPGAARDKMFELLEPVGPKEAPWQYFCVAGGLPLRAACPLPDPPEQEMRPDIDLWLLGDSAEQRTARARMCLAHLARHMPDHIAVLSRALVRLQPTKPGHAEAQLMVPEAKHSRGVTAMFDVDMVRCAFDGKHFQATPDACMSYACRTVLTSLCPVRAKRALKALAKGFIFGPGVRWECPDLEGAYLCLGLPEDRWPTTEPVKARINKKGELASDRPSRETDASTSKVFKVTAGASSQATADASHSSSRTPAKGGASSGAADASTPAGTAAEPSKADDESKAPGSGAGESVAPTTPARYAAAPAGAADSAGRTSARYIKREFTSVREALRAVPGAVLAARLGARGAVLQIMRAFDPAPFERLSPGWRLGPELQALVLQARETMQAAMAARAGVQPSVTAGQWRRGGGMWLPRRGHAERRKHRQAMLMRLQKEFGGDSKKEGGSGKGAGGAGARSRERDGFDDDGEDDEDYEPKDGAGSGEDEEAGGGADGGDETAVVQVSTHSELKDYEGRMEKQRAFIKRRGKGKDGAGADDQMGLDVGDEMTGYENQAVRSRRLDPGGVTGFPGRGDTRDVARWQARRRVMPVLLQIVRVWYYPPSAGSSRVVKDGERVQADADGGTLILSARRSEQRGAFECIYWLRQCLVLMAGQEEADACVPVCPAELEEDDALLAADQGGGGGNGDGAGAGEGSGAAGGAGAEGPDPARAIPPPAFDEARVVVDPGRSGSMLAVEAASPHAFVSGTSGPVRLPKGRGLEFLHGKCARAFVVVVPGRKAFCLRLQLHSPHEIDLRQSVYGMEKLVRYGAALRE